MGYYGDRVLPRILDLTMDTEQNRRIRRRVCEGLRGEVLEVGFGSGHNLPFLPAAVTRVLAVEPSGAGVRIAGKRIAASPAEVDVVGLDGQDLAVDDASVDAVLSTWTLCTIPDPVAAVREACRVLRPGGTVHFAEHGRAPDERVRRWQHRLNPLHRRIAGGCTLNRDIPAILEQGGLRIVRLDTYYARGEPKPFAAMYEGVAVAA